MLRRSTVESMLQVQFESAVEDMKISLDERDLETLERGYAEAMLILRQQSMLDLIFTKYEDKKRHELIELYFEIKGGIQNVNK